MYHSNYFVTACHSFIFTCDLSDGCISRGSTQWRHIMITTAQTLAPNVVTSTTWKYSEGKKDKLFLITGTAQHTKTTQLLSWLLQSKVFFQSEDTGTFALYTGLLCVHVCDSLGHSSEGQLHIQSRFGARLHIGHSKLLHGEREKHLLLYRICSIVSLPMVMTSDADTNIRLSRDSGFEVLSWIWGLKYLKRWGGGLCWSIPSEHSM